MRWFIFILFMLLSCLQFSQAQSPLQQQFNGRFRMYIKGEKEWQNHSFWEHLKPFDKDTCFRSHQNHSMQIEIIDEKRIRFCDVTDSCEEKSKVFRYRAKENVIIVRKCRNRRFYGIPPFFFITNVERLKLSIDENKDLLLEYRGKAWGMLFGLATGYDKNGTELYKRN